MWTSSSAERTLLWRGPACYALGERRGSSRPVPEYAYLQEPRMLARIYRPTRNAMQSGSGNSKRWVLDFEQEIPREVEPLMGWTSSADMRQQVQLVFDTKEEAIAYAERNGIAYQLQEPKDRAPKKIAYSDNFKWGRVEPWSH
jgi:hypothetical protein